MHPDYADPRRRDALLRLFDRVWLGLAAKIETAARFGWRWDEVTTPFARYRDGQALAHVGVLELPVLLEGLERRVAGLHAVCTDPGHRRQGHFRAVMEAALDHVDERWDIVKLSTSQPALYEPFGFRAVEQHRFLLRRSVSAPAGTRAAARARPVSPEDLPRLHDLLAHRAPLSRRFASLDAGWLFGIDEVLWTAGLSHLYSVDETVVAWEVDGDTLQIYDIAASSRPGSPGSSLETLLAACPWPFQRVVLWFTPDLWAPEAEPVPWPEDDVLMVRGPWPVASPFSVSLLAAH